MSHVLQRLHCCEDCIPVFHKGYITAKIVSLPHQQYVLEGNQATVRCQNRSDDGGTFYSYITTAVWYRSHSNGTKTQIGSSGPVYADKHTLILSSITEADQGFYYCCVPAGPCGNSSSGGTSILISSKNFNCFSGILVA